MRMGNYLWLVFLSLVSSYTYSADYYWNVSGYSGQYSSPAAACEAKRIAQTAYKSSTAELTQSNLANCVGVNSTGAKINFATSARFGDSCPNGGTYNSKDGTCSTKPPEDPCAGKVGQSTPFSKSGSGADGYMSIFDDGKGGKASAPSQTGCFNGCAASTAQQKCTVKVAGSYFCRGTAYYTGSACGTSTSPNSLDSSDTSAFPDAKTISDKKPCVYTTSSDGSQTCTSETSTEKEGQNCGTFNGTTVCADKKPNSEKMKIDTNVSETSNPDGSKTSTKVDVSTKTVCTAVQTCTTTTVTTTTKTTYDKDGKETGSTTTSNTTTGGGKTNAGTDGKGGSGDGEGEEGGVYSAQDWYKEGDDTYKSVLSDFSSKVQSLPIKNASTQFFTYNPSGNCPIYNFNVWFVKASFDGFCSNAIPWAAIRAVILATAAFFAFRIALLD